MKKGMYAIGLLTAFLVVSGVSSILAQQEVPNFEYKWQLHDYLAEQRGINLRIGPEKPLGPFDRKRAILNVGNVEARIRNSGTLGYDRDGKCYEFPSGSGITYRWTMAPLVGAIVNGQKWVACGTYGAARAHEDEFEPLGGLDAGWSSNDNNYGIAASDRSDTWPTAWPTDALMPPVGSKGFPGILDGEVVATRELYFAVTDSNNNSNDEAYVRIDMWGVQYEDFINEDFIIFKMIVTNISDKTLQDFYIGMHDDPDTPEQGTNEWMDDFAKFIAVDDDIEGYDDSQDSLLWNFAYLWDGDDKVEGLIASKVGWVGLKVLETPIDPATSAPMGLTTLSVFDYAAAPQTDITEYDQLASGIQAPTNVTPHPDDYTQTPNTYGPDITYVFASGPFQLEPGQSLNFALATIHGVNKKDLFNNAMLCQILYNNNYAAAEGPPEPDVEAHAGSHSVTLFWNGYDTENAIYRASDGSIDHIGDKLTGNNTFEGYAVYRSADRGSSWGDPMIDVTGAPMGYLPLAQYDIANGITGESETRPFFYLGDDTGLKHTFTDNTVNDGYEYWYAVIAYDHDDGPIPPMANAFKKNAYQAGDNVVAVIPLGDVSGFKAGSAGAITHTTGGADGVPVLEVLDTTAVTGDSYQITFVEAAGAAGSGDLKLTKEEAALQGDTKFTGPGEITGFTVTNTRTGAVAMAGANPVENFEFYDEDADNAPIFDGIKLMVPPVAYGPASITGSSAAYDDDYALYYYGWYILPSEVDHDYEMEFTAETYQVYSLWRIEGYDEPAADVNFKVTDVTTGQQIMPVWQDADDYNLVYDDWERIMFNHTPYGEEPSDYSGYMFRFWPYEDPAVGDKIFVVTNKPYTADDTYSFSTTKESYAGVKESDLANITTVPNPFVVSSRFEIGAYGTEKQLQFHYLPPKCTIRIYNLAGDFIRQIEHDDGTPMDTWNLQTYNEQEVAFGIYIYHVDAPGIGEYIGKMAIIK
jgi:hypothetical protein